jgi:hypothetical protein
MDPSSRIAKPTAPIVAPLPVFPSRTEIDEASDKSSQLHLPQLSAPQSMLKSASKKVISRFCNVRLSII